jgi:hypothetical protein
VVCFVAVTGGSCFQLAEKKELRFHLSENKEFSWFVIEKAKGLQAVTACSPFLSYQFSKLGWGLGQL